MVNYIQKMFFHLVLKFLNCFIYFLPQIMNNIAWDYPKNFDNTQDESCSLENAPVRTC